MAGGFLAYIGSSLTLILVSELFLILMIKEDKGGYKLRFLEWYRDSNLERYQKYIVVSAVGLLSLLLIDYLFANVLDSPVTRWIQSLPPVSAILYDSVLFFVVVGIFTYYSRGKEVDRNLVYLTAVVFVLLLAFAQIEYDILMMFS